MGSAGTERAWLEPVTSRGMEPWLGASPWPPQCPGRLTQAQLLQPSTYWVGASGGFSPPFTQLLVIVPGRCQGPSCQGPLDKVLSLLHLRQHWLLSRRQSGTWISGRSASSAVPPSDSWAWRAARVDSGTLSKCPASHGGVWSNFLRVVTYIILYLLNPLSRQQ